MGSSFEQAGHLSQASRKSVQSNGNTELIV